MLLDTPICDYGWRAPDFSLPDYDGTLHTLQASIGEQGLLVMFICNHCPYVKGIVNRLSSDTNTLLSLGIGVVAIMSNDYTDYPADSPDKMREFSNNHNFPFPYLVDEDQSVGKSYGAICTPDFFGFNKSCELQYRGRLDNLGKAGPDVSDTPTRVPELLSAMRQIADTGIGPADQSASMGCSIKWRV